MTPSKTSRKAASTRKSSTPRLTRLTPESANGASREMLSELVSRHGQVGDMVSTMAHSPAVLGGYLQLSRAMKRAKLDRGISERLSIAIQVHQGCELCLESHINAARALGIDEAEIERSRAGTSDDPAVAAIIALALQIYREPTSITDEQVSALREHCYSDREIADIVGIVTLNILTMMGLLLFDPSPARVAMIGLGGGSLVRFFARHLPRNALRPGLRFNQPQRQLVDRRRLAPTARFIAFDFLDKLGRDALAFKLNAFAVFTCGKVIC